MVAWPSSSWIARRSAPPSRRCVAKRVPEGVRMDRALGPGRGGPRPAGGAGRRWSTAAGRSWRGTAAGASASTASAGRPRVQVGAHGAERVLARGDEARLGALALHAQLLAVEVDAGDVERDELLRAQAAAVGDLEQRAVAQLERRGRRDAIEQRADVLGVERPAGAAGPCAAAAAGRRGWRPCGRARPASRRTAGRRRACGRRSWRPRGARRGGRRSGAASCSRPRPGRPRARRTSRASWPRSMP